MNARPQDISHPPAGHGEPTCYHCGLPVPHGSDYRTVVLGERREMCCPGCAAVASAIVEGGLEDYYRYRTARPEGQRDLVPEALSELALYDRPEVQRSFVRGQGEQREAALILEGIVCAACAWLSERHVKELPGVVDFNVNYTTHRARLRWDESRTKLSDVLAAIAAIGYRAHPFDPSRQADMYQLERARMLKQIAVAGIGMMQVMMVAIGLYAGDHGGMTADTRSLLRWISFAFATPVVFYASRGFFAAAWRDLRRRTLGMDVPVALAVSAAYAASTWATLSGTGEVYFDSVTMFVFFLLVGRFLEMLARHRAGQTAEALVRLKPAMARRLDAEGGEERIAASELCVGDRVRVRAGESIPADGRVIEGTSSVDESLLTGEHMPHRRVSGDIVLGGAINVESPITVSVTAVGPDSTLSAILRLLDRALSEKPRLAVMADHVAGGFVAGLLLTAILVFAFWYGHDPERAFWVTLSVLVVTCPCALSLAMPAALTAATGTMSRLGLLAARGHVLEALSKTSDVVFDKTGTLTYGRPELVVVDVAEGEDVERCLQWAAALERDSGHPVAQAFKAYVTTTMTVEGLAAEPGFGVAGVIEGRRMRIGRPAWVAGEETGVLPLASDADGEGDMIVWLADEVRVLAAFRLRDRLRPGVAAAVTALRARGIKVHVYSGDNQPAVAEVAGRIGIDDAIGDLAPAGKLDALRRLQTGGATVAMIGDGINDAPVLAGADVSIALSAGAQLAHASADMVLLSDRLERLPQAVDVARRCQRIVRQNLAWAVGYNLFAVPLAAAGWIAPWMAAIGMSASSLVVVMNALRLRDLPGDHGRGREEAV
ncbi:heavy metal translocating P-type ATPase [Acidihalobacter prosperus]|uniref:Cation transporter n=1 Tax=Acidihalobacter prosperus TaxID=160660 RepID=A0A1A6C0V8_9GAMM|nr:heavy metal translocating P-type ATPase [Acidihalobacter prosperus]OBS08196.1 cation transporter [Acidihalobacter prosperus]